MVIAAACAFLMRALKQPMIIAYLLAGVIIGPAVLSLTHESEFFQTLAEIGIAFLLFTVGLGLNWRRIREVGAVAIASGLGQIIFTSVVGFLILYALGFDLLTSLFVGLAFSFSSTIIIVKMLMDKEDLETLYGKITVGFLIVQDLVAMVVLLILGALGRGESMTQILGFSFLKGIFVVAVFWLLSNFVIPHIVKFAASSQELLLVFSLGWCFAVAGVLSFFGFGVEIGALIAGVSLSGTVYEHEINSRVKPLRDFFLILFFIVLGTQLHPAAASEMIIPIIAMVVFVLIGNPLIMMLFMRALGYHPETSFLTGTTTAQISEFSFIMLGAAVALGLISPDAMTLTTIVGLITIAVSTYFIKENELIYEKLQPILRVFEKQRARHAAKAKRLAAPSVILFGCHRTGEILIDEIQKMRRKFLVVDYDPYVIEELKHRHIPVVYGDGGDEDFLFEIKAESAKLILSSIPDVTTSLELLNYLRERKFKGTAIVAARTPEEAMDCYAAGADYVIVPSILGAEKFRDLLKKNQSEAKQWKKSRKIEKADVRRGVRLDEE